MAAALALRLQGRSVRLLERAAEFGEVGAGLQLAPNATRILREWGVLDWVLAAGVEPQRIVLRDEVSGDELTHLDLGEECRAARSSGRRRRARSRCRTRNRRRST
ncbi:hypothetical protein AB0I53_20170 [Saccharopolyspora sp. NPDC050389]|uniref:hypothetical protein n=1 Tax=Saccharopolyspora sp. NPDC050389 TaxID=3155516 RepID=UPI003408BE7B